MTGQFLRLWRWLVDRVKRTETKTESQPETHGVKSNIRVSAWDKDVLETAVGVPPADTVPSENAWWTVFDSATEREDGPRPVETWTTHNITCNPLHRHLAGCLNPTTPSNPDASRVSVAIGTGTGVDPSTTDEELVSEQARYTARQYTTDGRQTSIRAILSTEQGNGLNISEVGVVGPNGLWNHATFSPTIDKSSSIALTVEIIFSVLDESEATA